MIRTLFKKRKKKYYEKGNEMTKKKKKIITKVLIHSRYIITDYIHILFCIYILVKRHIVFDIDIDIFCESRITTF